MHHLSNVQKGILWVAREMQPIGLKNDPRLIGPAKRLEKRGFLELLDDTEDPTCWIATEAGSRIGHQVADEIHDLLMKREKERRETL